MRISHISGCCAGYILYDLGGQHGHNRSKNQEEFDSKLKSTVHITGNSIIIAITNEYQNPEREFLEKVGFKSVKANNSLTSHTIGASTLRSYLHSRESALKKYLEDKKITQEKIKSEEKSKFAPVPGAYVGLVRLADVNEILRRFPERSHNHQVRRQLINAIHERYNVRVSYSPYDYSELIRGRIYRAVARQRRGG